MLGGTAVLTVGIGIAALTLGSVAIGGYLIVWGLTSSPR